MAWLPGQEHFDVEKVYGMDTRRELGETIGRLAFVPKIPFVIGAQESFKGLRTIIKRFADVAPHIKFHTTLDETCEAAIELAKKL